MPKIPIKVFNNLDELIEYLDLKISRVDGKITPEEHHAIERGIIDLLNKKIPKTLELNIDNNADVLQHDDLKECLLLSVFTNGAMLQKSKIPFNSTEGSIDFTEVGGLQEGNWIVINFSK